MLQFSLSLRAGNDDRPSNQDWIDGFLPKTSDSDVFLLEL